MVGAPWLAEEKLDENTTLPHLDSFRRRKPEVEHAHGFFASVHDKLFGREFKPSHSYGRYSVDETVNNVRAR